MASEQEYTVDSPQTSIGKFIRQGNQGDFKNNRKWHVIVLNRSILLSEKKKQFFLCMEDMRCGRIYLYTE